LALPTILWGKYAGQFVRNFRKYLSGPGSQSKVVSEKAALVLTSSLQQSFWSAAEQECVGNLTARCGLKRKELRGPMNCGLRIDLLSAALSWVVQNDGRKPEKIAQSGQRRDDIVRGGLTRLGSREEELGQVLYH
jgi:hypothetical protein